MKTKMAKVFVSLLLIAVIAVSAIVPSAAASKFVEYRCDFYTAGSDGISQDYIYIKIHGENGSTDWCKIMNVGFSREWHNELVNATIDVGKVTGVSVKNNCIDGWYPEKIVVTSPSKEKTTIHCGAWVDNGDEVRFDVTDNVFELNIKTSSVLFSGTDQEVFVILYDQNGVASKPAELSSIYPYADAFERGDDATMIVSAPDNFGKLSGMKLYIDISDDTLASDCPDWRVHSVKITQLSGADTGTQYYKALNQVCGEFDVIKIDF